MIIVCVFFFLQHTLSEMHNLSTLQLTESLISPGEIERHDNTVMTASKELKMDAVLCKKCEIRPLPGDADIIFGV